jgi:hypothetical protein
VPVLAGSRRQTSNGSGPDDSSAVSPARNTRILQYGVESEVRAEETVDASPGDAAGGSRGARTGRAARRPRTRPDTGADGNTHSGPAVLQGSSTGIVDDDREVVATVYRTEADKPLTFRFGRDENEWLETVCFEITRSTGVKMHKQDVVRLGLHLALLDYKRRGEESVAVQLSRRLSRREG